MICPNCNGNLYDSPELARAHAELLDAGRSISVSCAYCGAVHVRKPEGAPVRRRAEERRIDDGYPAQSQIQSAYAPAYPGGHGSHGERRPLRVSPPLAVGIFFLPYVFAWFTLKEGYSSQARWVSFGWLAFMVFATGA